MESDRDDRDDRIDRRLAELYDDIPAYASRPDIDFYLELAREAPGEVLELGAGTGRILIPIAEAGIAVTGLERSEAMLRVCRARLARKAGAGQQRIDLVLDDMADFALGRRFGLITIPFRTFHHLLDVERQLSCLAAVRRHLLPGGRLALDLYNPKLSVLTAETPMDLLSEEPFPLRAGGSAARHHALRAHDPIGQILTFAIRYELTDAQGTRQDFEHRFDSRYFFRYEIEHLLARGGFHVEALYEDFARTPFGQRSAQDIVLVARIP